MPEIIRTRDGRILSLPDELTEAEKQLAIAGRTFAHDTSPPRGIAVDLPNGKRIIFPEGTDEAQMQVEILNRYPDLRPADWPKHWRIPTRTNPPSWAAEFLEPLTATNRPKGKR
ncbi:MAG TPA: hypothetical protein VJ063_12570 [Verrucomicrobiae bacterium]|nr:hypothetical protein [Verrucomicrobiae bacterium]